MTDWPLVIAVLASTCILQYIGWKILKELELTHQRIGWMQEDVQKIRKLGESQT